MKINNINFQTKGNHPGIIVTWTEKGKLMRETVKDRFAAIDFAIQLLWKMNWN